ncbi:retrovirus-related pol polyprotein from transposon TNT 1-94 [Tanacetum coccineum]
MMKGSHIRIQEKKDKLFNKWERFTSTDGESIESYYHRFSNLMNDFKRNKHFPKKIAIQNVGNQVVQNAVHNPGVQNVRNQNGLVVVLGIANQNLNGNGNVIAARVEGNAIGNNGNQIRCYNCKGLGHLARNCIVRLRRRDVAYLQTQLLIAQKEEAESKSAEEYDLIAAAAKALDIQGTQTDKAPVYDSDGSAKCGTRGGTVYLHPATIEETRAYFESLYNNLAIGAEKSVYQEQYLTKKINALHLSSGKPITTLNEEISNLNEQLSKEKSTISSLLEEKKRLKSDFKIREDELLDKQIQLENKIKELDNFG